MTGTDPLLSLVLDLAERLLDGAEVTAILERICGHCVEVLPVRGAGVILYGDGDGDGAPRFAAASDRETGLIERHQLTVGEGPCLAAWEQGEHVEEPDLTDGGARRWPVLGPFLLERGIAAVSSFPLVHQRRRLGALSLFREQPGALDEERVRMARMLAGATTIYVLHSDLLRSSRETIEQLQTALESRVVIEQAKGKLSQQLGVGVEESFQLLRRHARNHNLRLHDLARGVVTGAVRLEVDAARD